jgi:hypothetical protein
MGEQRMDLGGHHHELLSWRIRNKKKLSSKKRSAGSQHDFFLLRLWRAQAMHSCLADGSIHKFVPSKHHFKYKRGWLHTDRVQIVIIIITVRKRGKIGKGGRKQRKISKGSVMMLSCGWEEQQECKTLEYHIELSRQMQGILNFLFRVISENFTTQPSHCPKRDFEFERPIFKAIAQSTARALKKPLVD